MKIFILAHIDEYIGKQSRSCAAGGRRYKLVQLFLEDNLTLAFEISNVYICWLRTSKYLSFKTIYPYALSYTDGPRFTRIFLRYHSAKMTHFQ